MEIEVTNREEDPVIDREYIRFKVKHVSEPTPSRGEVKEALVKELPTDVDLLTVLKVQSRYGRPISDGEAFLYGSEEVKERFSKSYLLERTGEIKEKEGKEVEAEPKEEPEGKEKEKESGKEERKEEPKEGEKEEEETEEEEPKGKEHKPEEAKAEEEEVEEEPEEESEKEEEKEGVKCPECGRVFDTERGMKIHKSKSH